MFSYFKQFPNIWWEAVLGTSCGDSDTCDGLGMLVSDAFSVHPIWQGARTLFDPPKDVAYF